jgi:HD-like signal output (HDOD) protein
VWYFRDCSTSVLFLGLFHQCGILGLSHICSHTVLYFLNKHSVISLTQLHCISEYCKILNTPLLHLY